MWHTVCIYQLYHNVHHVDIYHMYLITYLRFSYPHLISSSSLYPILAIFDIHLGKSINKRKRKKYYYGIRLLCIAFYQIFIESLYIWIFIGWVLALYLDGQSLLRGATHILIWPPRIMFPEIIDVFEKIYFLKILHRWIIVYNLMFNFHQWTVTPSPL